MFGYSHVDMIQFLPYTCQVAKKIIIDALGGDKGLGAIIEGVKLAMSRHPELEIVLVGDEVAIKSALPQKLLSRVEIIHTTTNIAMDEHPTEAIRSKTQSSLVLGLTALKTREDCGAFVSAGSTGAVLTGAFMKVGRIPGVSRPALCPILPTFDKKGVMVVDVGANMDCKPLNLAHFAIMTDVYIRELRKSNLKISQLVKAVTVDDATWRPRLALLNVGTEDTKGNELTHGAFELMTKLKAEHGINFVGNMEARETFSGKYDAIICDGFHGNVLLKTLEGAGQLFGNGLKEAMRGFVGTIGKLILARRLLKMKRTLHEDATGGAIFLGVNKPVIKAHGNASPTALYNTIRLGMITAEMNLGEKIKQSIDECAPSIAE